MSSQGANNTGNANNSGSGSGAGSGHYGYTHDSKAPAKLSDGSNYQPLKYMKCPVAAHHKQYELDEWSDAQRFVRAS